MTNYNPKIHHRRSIRLKGYDYSQPGSYFITMCTKNRKCLFGDIVDDEMILNDAGKMVEEEWLKLPDRFPNIQLHEFVVMPNHIHGILEIMAGGSVTVTDGTTVAGATLVVAPTVGDMVGAFKSIVTVKYIEGVKTKNWERFDKKLLQRDFWDQIIRNDAEFGRIARYITNNPRNWKYDKLKCHGSKGIVNEPYTPYGEEDWMI
jgi:REP element-mobilizing transposase RayT